MDFSTLISVAQENEANKQVSFIEYIVNIKYI